MTFDPPPFDDASPNYPPFDPVTADAPHIESIADSIAEPSVEVAAEPAAINADVLPEPKWESNRQTQPLPPDFIPDTLPEAVTAIAGFRVALNLETILYLAFAAIALILHLFNLGAVVLNDSEAHEGLALFRALNPVLNPITGGTTLITRQPLAFAANLLVTLVGGDTNVTVRLATTLLGVGIVLIPLLYRRWIGRTQALVMAGLLAISPVLLTASRTVSGTVWSIMLALIGLWLVGRFVETNRRWFAIAASIVLGMLVLATDQSGLLVALMLVIGVAVALMLSPDSSEGARLRSTLRGWPWLIGCAAVALALLAIGTAFWLHPSGLGALGDTIARSLSGFVVRPVGTPFAFPLLTSLFYEPVLWLFGIIGIVQVLHGHGGFIHRLFFGWLMAAIVLSFIYAGAGADAALWLTIPLVGLSALVIAQSLTPVVDQLWGVPLWGPWLHALGTVAVFGIGGMNLLHVAQQALTVTPELIPRGIDVSHLLLIGLAILLGGILYFLVGSIWGNRAAGRGFQLGALIFLTAYSLSAGLQAAVTRADDPRELWRVTPVSQTLTMLDEQLTSASLRSSGMSGSTALTVVGSDDSAVAWIVRRFPKTSFVAAASGAINTPLVITTAGTIAAPGQDTTTAANINITKPTLGAAYVGEPFSIYPTWDRGTLQDWDIFAWGYDRETRTPVNLSPTLTLWVRSDVYGVPADSLTNAAAPAAQG